MKTVVAMGSFTMLAAALEAANLAELLVGERRFTVFAPGDAAFAELPTAALAALMADEASLVRLLSYHVAPGLPTLPRVRADGRGRRHRNAAG